MPIKPIDILYYIFVVISVMIFLTLFSIHILYILFNKIFKKEIIPSDTNVKDSDSRSACSEYSSRSEEKRVSIITKCFTLINENMPDQISETINNIIERIYGDKKKKNKFKFLNNLLTEKKTIKNNKNKGNVRFKENEEFMLFD